MIYVNAKHDTKHLLSIVVQRINCIARCHSCICYVKLPLEVKKVVMDRSELIMNLQQLIKDIFNTFIHASINVNYKIIDYFRKKIF